jgi:hypothetical protein
VGEEPHRRPADLTNTAVESRGVRQIYLLAEGQTEERFVKAVLVPHLRPLGIDLEPVIAQTKRMATGAKHRGGITSWHKVESDLRGLLGASHAVAVTTMIDLYGLPPDWPGCSLDVRPARDKVAAVEAAMTAAIGDRRFLPHVMLHEFETLLFTAPDVCADWAGDPQLEHALSAAVKQCGEAELVNDGSETAPSKRLKRAWPAYAKTVDAPGLVDTIGLTRMRAACPHFDGWISQLESL